MRLVFLHCSGGDMNDYSDIFIHISEAIGAKMLSFNAPFIKDRQRLKYLWFNKYENTLARDAIVADFDYSVEYIKEKLLSFGGDLSDIVLIGHSQGGAMASIVASVLGIKLGVSICGDIPYNIRYACQAKTPILWFEASKDTYLDDRRKFSHKLLSEKGIAYEYCKLPNSTHMDFSCDVELIIEKLTSYL